MDRRGRAYCKRTGETLMIIDTLTRKQYQELRKLKQDMETVEQMNLEFLAYSSTKDVVFPPKKYTLTLEEFIPQQGY